jgi:spore maturation protein CgeB
MRFLFCNRHSLWRQTLPWGLERTGHAVVVPSSYDPIYLDALVDTFAPEVVLTAGWVQDYVPANIRAIRRAAARAGALSVYWATEDIQHFHSWSLPFARAVGADVVVTINAACVPEYRARGFGSEFLDFGCNTDLFGPRPPDPAHACDVVLVANPYDFTISYREQSLLDLLAPLLGEPGLDLRVWGEGWEEVAPGSPLSVPRALLRGPAPYASTPTLYTSAGLVLGPQNENRFPTQVTMRTFEVLSCGAALLTSATWAVARMFRSGHHLLVSDSPESTRALVRRYLADEDGRAGLGRAGRELVWARHTYAHRAAALTAVASARLGSRRTWVPAPRPPRVPVCLELAPDYIAGTEGELLVMAAGARVTFTFTVEVEGREQLRAALRLWERRAGAERPPVWCRSGGQPPVAAVGPDADGWWSWDCRVVPGTSELTLGVDAGAEGQVEFASANWSGDAEFRPRLLVIHYLGGDAP